MYEDECRDFADDLYEVFMNEKDSIYDEDVEATSTGGKIGDWCAKWCHDKFGNDAKCDVEPVEVPEPEPEEEKEEEDPKMLNEASIYHID